MLFGAMNNPRENLLKELREICEKGMEYVEMTIEWPCATVEIVREKKREIMDIVNSYNIRLLGHAPWFFEFGHPYDSIRRAVIFEAKKVLDLSSELGIETVTFHPHSPGWIDKRYKDKIVRSNIDTFKEIVNYSKERNIKVCIENIDYGIFSDVKSIARIVNSTPGLMFTLDVGHAFMHSDKMDKLKAYVNRLGDQVDHLHVHDNKCKGEDLHIPVGAGNINWKEACRILRNLDNVEKVTIEVHCKDKDYLVFSKNKFLEYWSS